MSGLRLSLLAGLCVCASTPAAPPAPTPVTDNVRAVGEVTADKGTITVKGPTAILVLGLADADAFRLTAEVEPADKATSVSVQAMPTEPTDVTKRAVLSGSFYRDAPGLQLQVSAQG